MSDNIYEALSAPLPEEAVDRTKGVETKKGYDTTGYRYQYAVNRLNEVMGPENWRYEWEILREACGEFQSGRPRWEITVKTSISLLVGDHWTDAKSCVGGHVSTTHEDALKGAITNSFKKTAAFFGVGKQAYEGSIDEDMKPQEEGAATPVKAPAKDVEPKEKSPRKKLVEWAQHFSSSREVQEKLCKRVASFRDEEGKVVEPKEISKMSVKWAANAWKNAQEITDEAEASILLQYETWDDYKKRGKEDVPMGEPVSPGEEDALPF